MAHPARQIEIRVGPQGRVVIPAEIRRAVGLAPGQTLVARAERNRIILETRENVLERAKARFAAVPSDVKFADELIADRRKEAARE